MAGSSPTDLAPIVAAVAGAIVAEGTHVARAGVRPVSTATTGGVGNPVLSVVEDVTSAVLTVVALLAPLLAVALVAVLVWLAVRAIRRFRARRAGAAPV
jgi:hypothetical protein